MKRKILFVCLGNICRSPAADAIMHKLVADRGLAADFEIDSAGTYPGHAGSLPNDQMRRVGSSRGYDLTHRSRPFRLEDFDKFDMIVVMDNDNYRNICRRAHDDLAINKVSRMADYCRRFEVEHVPDPYGEPMNVYQYVFDIIEDGCKGLLDSIIE